MQSRTGALVPALFFCSGATALVYEVVWSKFLVQMLGSTIYAQTVVLAAFMGGLAIGNWLFGRGADRRPQPLRTYGVLEIAIGLYALLFPALGRGADGLFVRCGIGISHQGALLLVLKAGLSAALLLGPAILMGGTLPLLAAWLQRSCADPGRRSARFYAINSLGAVLGAALAGFWLVQSFGMVGSLRLTALVNLLIGALAGLLSRRQAQADTALAAPGAPASLPACVESSDGRQDAGAPGGATPQILRRAGLIVACTGAISMGLEVLASRCLVLIFGSSLQSFALVLVSFILGIGLGSAWISSPRRKSRALEGQLVLLLCLPAVWLGLLVFNIEWCVNLYRLARTVLPATPTGYVYHELLATGLSLVVLGLPAACIGAVLPLMLRAAAQSATPLGAQVGALLTWNTLGAVGGSLFAGFVLMPTLGLRDALASFAFALAALAGLVAWQWRQDRESRHPAGVLAVGQTPAGMPALPVTPRTAWVAPLAAAGVITLLLLCGPDDWRQVMSSGVFRLHEKTFDSTLLPLRKQHTHILFYEDAPDATVSVEWEDDTGPGSELSLRINGKPDASTRGDLSTQMLLAHIPMLARPEAKDVFVLGLGTGISAGTLLSYPVERVVVAENCAPVLRAAPLFNDYTHGLLSDQRVQIWCEDARTVLKLSPQRYDVIITEPSNPWSVGVGSVFSQEYYRLAASRLKPGGIMAQWFHIYEMSDEVVGLVLRTFSSVFPVVEVWETSPGDIVLLGAQQPWPSGPEVFRSGFAIDQVRAELGVIGIASPEAFLARQIASQRTGFAIADKGPLQSDLFPLLEYAAPKAFYMGDLSRLLNRYDERTRQQELAPPQKRAAMLSLGPEGARSVFAYFPSVNEELRATLDATNSLLMATACAFSTNSVPRGQEATGPALRQAVAALNAREFERAAQLVSAAAGQAPAEPLPAYLGRILERERQQTTKAEP